MERWRPGVSKQEGHRIFQDLYTRPGAGFEKKKKRLDSVKEKLWVATPP